jgi:hypothetical protein
LSGRRIVVQLCDQSGAELLSQSDIDTIRKYVERLKAAQPLTAPEAQDFYRIADIITHEYPANEGSWMLFLIASFVLGLTPLTK